MEQRKLIIRYPAVAGQFYPYDREELRATGEEFLSAAKREENVSPSILIVPHAGWEFSGRTAATAFAQIKGGGFTKVILVGPSHHALFEGAAIDDSDFWQTPLGKVAVEKTLADKILAPGEKIAANRQVHVNEHCLEVELPFLQLTLSDFKIVPILIGQANEDVLRLLAQRISAIMAKDKKVLLVVSSDLSHYPDIDTARVVDGQTIEAILTVDEGKFSQTLDRLTTEYPQVDTFACGQQAIKVGLMVAKNLGVDRAKLFSKTNSGEVTGQTDHVVGYAAIGFYGKIPNSKFQISKLKTEEKLAPRQRKTLLRIARQTLESYLNDGKIPKIEVTDRVLSQKRGVFVTLKKHGQLRGCIGQFFPDEPLYRLVQDMAVSAAVHDSRFSPLQYNELADVKIEISILSPMRKVNSWQDIELGKEGVYLKHGNRTATFLPQVATETNWSREEFLSQLCVQKAGLSSDCYLDSQTELFVYTAQVFGE